VVGKRDGKQALIIHDAQHEYAFIETSPHDRPTPTNGRSHSRPGTGSSCQNGHAICGTT
jgi:hypothetical protein